MCVRPKEYRRLPNQLVPDGGIFMTVLDDDYPRTKESIETYAETWVRK